MKAITQLLPQHDALTDLRYSVATPARAMQEKLSRLPLLSRPLLTSA